MGGNGANNAVGSVRLGLNNAIYTVYGKDTIGDMIENTFKTEGVNSEYLTQDQNAGSDTAVVVTFQHERTIIVYHEKRDYALPNLKPAKWVYYTSLMKGFETIHPALINYLKQNQVKLAFNPGTHQLLAGKDRFKDLLVITELLIVNKEEAQRFLELNSTEIKELLLGLHNLGPKVAVITDGEHGSYSYDGMRYLFQPILDGTIVERTGCGDSYSTGIIAALIHGGDIKDGMVWGTINGWSVVQKVGPQAGLLHKEEMEKLIKSHPNLRPKIF
ncbi:MAG: hypothetical protein A3F33_02145 [Candidatus Woykebacteria bacterium RIFCSPHIGHO2_12_FULL_43_10]|uniref:Carbohydrate kinase PfkB domain-containing protein n=2 Tax=Candidatus Woykeibacteriota TaxID=1817899 RepID=A0A1G1WX72_9BACT|nr:MAG: hypothetical protein A2802_01055 [Candidatus Woykebacteria bacterium RIFCSPHIGHO2_01_FULL_43_29]OGY28612.1 MAG: hypothetical protein A3J50_02680 [Candidatus Woykebacteria bacterium RIFCSPHIGHO2_02_FULL_43_16b]OGY28764.1 MAG: hypothetical protein A3F33_02145 [Candidatus Woykebacteria bacterium RIFCSPHIGHO2_12_FULL_43_10]OGY32294.1 MAG: hypothetical protein A3A61_04380 [Candidatus Woykebacteria bacterium RIFCSPLOWO2_01_FULL_43_14]